MSFRLQLALVLMIGASAAGCVTLMDDRWVVATDVQSYYRCLPFTWYLVDTEDSSFLRGSLVQFDAPEQAERLPKDFPIIKLVAGIPGDSYEVKDGRLVIGGRDWGRLHLNEALGGDASEFKRVGVLGEEEIIVLGTNPSSYDSRYWGPLSTGAITGRAYALL